MPEATMTPAMVPEEGTAQRRRDGRAKRLAREAAAGPVKPLRDAKEDTPHEKAAPPAFVVEWYLAPETAVTTRRDRSEATQ